MDVENLGFWGVRGYIFIFVVYIFVERVKNLLVILFLFVLFYKVISL